MCERKSLLIAWRKSCLLCSPLVRQIYEFRQEKTILLQQDGSSSVFSWNDYILAAASPLESESIANFSSFPKMSSRGKIRPLGNSLGYIWKMYRAGLSSFCSIKSENRCAILESLVWLQLSQSSPGNMAGSYCGQNMRGGNILATSVLLNYPKVCPLTKKKF